MSSHCRKRPAVADKTKTQERGLLTRHALKLVSSHQGYFAALLTFPSGSPHAPTNTILTPRAWRGRTLHS